jgi:hypothetical protein
VNAVISDYPVCVLQQMERRAGRLPVAGDAIYTTACPAR